METVWHSCLCWYVSMFAVSEFLGFSLPYIKVNIRTKLTKRVAYTSALKMELKWAKDINL
jgi:hypothetical protein